MSKGLFITFEGVDGAGKSTQIRFASEYLTSLGFNLFLTREPGGCPLAEKMRDILLNPENKELCDRAESLLYAAARAQHVHEVILPALNRGDIVICDRFIDSSLAYQGFGRKLGFKEILKINDFALDGLKIDKTFFLYVNPGNAFKRMNENKVYDRMEIESKEFFERTFDGFLTIAKKYDRIKLIDASGSKYDTAGIIRAELDSLILNL